MEFEQSVVIKRPVEEVFAFLEDPGNETQWQRGLVESRQTSPGPLGVGATGRDVRRFMGRQIITVWEVTEYRPPEMYGFRVVKGPVPFEGAYTFERVPEGTRVVMTARAEMRGLSRLMTPIIVRSGRSQYQRDFGTLKALLESRP